MAFQREVEETRGALNRYKADLSGLQSEQERLSSNTERLNKLFALLVPVWMIMPMCWEAAW